MQQEKKPKCAPTAEKFGWIKKSSGGLLGLWKDRYLLLRNTQLVVCEDEDEQKCIETVELESYDKCQELRALLKRKNRFILIRSPGKKVHDIKFQAPTLEEKESWIKALNEGINRGKNKIFDEVKVDESLSLDHVTRDRVKMTQGRRPPTRSHLKEAAKATSDGILRLDLDIVDNGPPNLDSTISEGDNPLPEKETPKPPMPPTKPTEDPKAPSEEDRETLTEVSNKGSAKAPIPLPKSVPDKLKVAWDQPVPETQNTEDLQSSGEGSKGNLEEIATADVAKPLVPPKVLSEKLVATINSSQGDLEAAGLEDLESHSSSPPANGIKDSEEAEATSPKSVEVTMEKKTSAESTLALKLRSSSLGDLLSDSKTTQGALTGPGFPKVSRRCVAEMEEKVASEREKTEKLLQKVLRGGLEQGQGENGPPVMAETLLNEAVEQLLQATQVLQEIKDLGELRKEATETRKGKQKALVTLYRRSAP
uniref:Pleckstrin homology domain containing O2 n=1 Tax=Nothoprocta perdicaria TaxID=30464 RepID=A0A8C6ZDZ4_NOTPE